MQQFKVMVVRSKADIEHGVMTINAIDAAAAVKIAAQILGGSQDPGITFEKGDPLTKSADGEYNYFADSNSVQDQQAEYNATQLVTKELPTHASGVKSPQSAKATDYGEPRDPKSQLRVNAATGGIEQKSQDDAKDPTKPPPGTTGTKPALGVEHHQEEIKEPVEGETSEVEKDPLAPPAPAAEAQGAAAP